MADRIVDNQIAYRTDVPWHGKGYGLQEGDFNILQRMNAEQETAFWLQKAKLDWTVQRRQIAMRGISTDPTVPAPMLTEQLKNFRAIVRKDTDEVFCVSTARYVPMQNADVVKFFVEYSHAGHAQIETVGAIDGGRKVWALAKLTTKEHAFTVGKEDTANAYMLLATSHDGTLQTIGKPTLVYVVCWNTLSAALGIGSGARLGKREQYEFRMKHTRTWSEAVAKEARRVMGMAIESAEHTTEIANALAKVSIDAKGRTEFIQRLIVPADQREQEASAEETELGRLGNALNDAILLSPGSELVERKGTAWGLVNGVTHYVDHTRGRGQDTRLNAAWFGDGDRLKRDSVRVAAEIAGLEHLFALDPMGELVGADR